MNVVKLFELASRMDKIGVTVTRVGLIVVLLWIGGLKAFRYRERHSSGRHPYGIDLSRKKNKYGEITIRILDDGKALVAWEGHFGDGWRHEILFEGFPAADPKAKCPLCVEGERACPPEDCGGPWGYGDYLAAITDPQHEQHEEMLEWRGSFNPEAFDAKKATKGMRRIK